MEESKTVLLGPWGGEGGKPWNYTPIGEISNIFITYDSKGINSIRFTSTDEKGRSYQSGVHGIANGTEKEIKIDSKVEKLISMEGTVGIYNSVKMVTSLGFTTSKTKHEPVGTGKKDSEFSLLLRLDPFSGFCGRSYTVLNSIGVSVAIKTREVVGPWPGSSGGGEWDYIPKSEISHISITYDDDYIHSLHFACKDADGSLLDESPIFGVADGSKQREIVIDTNVRKLAGIRGAYGPWRGSTLLKSLSFVITNRISFGPFGIQRDMDTSFSYIAQGEERVTGFHGRAGSLIDSVGVYIRPSKHSILVGPFIANDVGSPWAYNPEGMISRIYLNLSGYVYSLQFEYRDEKGIKHTSQVFGAKGPYGGDRTIDIEEDDKLTNIRGNLFVANSDRALISLCFSTEKKVVYGPLDGRDLDPNGFSFPVKDGYISGFHGRMDSSLRALGVYVKPT